MQRIPCLTGDCTQSRLQEGIRSRDCVHRRATDGRLSERDHIGEQEKQGRPHGSTAMPAPRGGLVLALSALASMAYAAKAEEHSTRARFGLDPLPLRPVRPTD